MHIYASQAKSVYQMLQIYYILMQHTENVHMCAVLFSSNVEIIKLNATFPLLLSLLFHTCINTQIL